MIRITRASLMAAAIFALVAFALPGSGQVNPDQPATETYDGHAVVAREVLIKFIARVPPQDLAEEADADSIREVGGIGVRQVHSRSLNTTALVARFAHRPDVEYVEPNYIVTAVQTPDDPYSSQLWAMPKIGANQAWDVTTGSTANVVGVVDTGITYTHPDLAANVWSAPSSFTVNIGGRDITCAAGTHGFNAIRLTCDPLDDNNHGTHVSGTIGAVGNNGIGVAGVNWTASIMGLKFLNAAGSGTTADAINAIEFAVQAHTALGGAANVRVLSNSWGGGGYQLAMRQEIARANANGMLFVAAAGNNGTNNDTTAFYPANYDVPNVVSVAATDSNDGLASFSNYGQTTVDLGAPGVNILSTVRNGYASYSGTSMATPHVSGAAALLLSACTLDTAALRAAIVDNVDIVSSLIGKSVTGGRLNVLNALGSCASTPPPDFSLAATPSSQTVTAGNTADYTINVTPTGSFSDPVAFTASGLPSGATASFSPNPTTGSTTLAIMTATSTSPGTFPITVTGSSGSLSDTTTVTLVVQAPAAQDFSLSASRSVLNVKHGATGSFTVTVTSMSGFTGDVALSFSGTPQDTAISAFPSTVHVDANQSATSKVTVTAGSVTGRFTVVITGTSATLVHSTSIVIAIK